VLYTLPSSLGQLGGLDAAVLPEDVADAELDGSGLGAVELDAVL